MATPTSTLNSGYGQVHGGFPQLDENLPEVVIDTSPQALSKLEAEYKRNHLEEHEPKYPALDDTTLKMVVPTELEIQGQYPQTSISPDESVPSESTTAAKQAPGAEEPPAKDGKIFGLTRKVFFIILVVLFVVIAASVGGGVGGTVASSRSNKPAPATTSSEPSSSTSTASTTLQSSTSTPAAASITSQSSTSTSTSSSTASASPTATFLNNQTAPANSLAFQGFSETDYQGNATAIIRDEGATNFTFDINSYVWLPNTTACCLSFCTNATQEGLIGWRCDARYQKQSSGSFGRIFVWCGLEHTNENAKCV
ncbi:hypothetical protein BKA61DRAFT_734246 [Leptodontidium sp. MPI-SDFR-AT-0119]|nr:hypothetical protein BKA61DRAFT_734246 [Leptodontidium sp. MPI-SDFR-AT-0119]